VLRADHALAVNEVKLWDVPEPADGLTQEVLDGVAVGPADGPEVPLMADNGIMRQLQTVGCFLPILALLAAVFPAAGADAPVLERIIKSNTMRVGMTLDQPPLNAEDSSGEEIGLDVDLARLLALAFDVKLKIVEKEFNELLPALKKGEVDMVISGVGITPERAVEVTFVGPYVLSGKSLLTKSTLIASAVEIEDLEDEELKIAVLRDSTSESFARKRLPLAKLVEVGNYGEGVTLVRQDKVDALLADMPVCVISALRYEDEGLKTLEQPLSLEPIGIAIADGDPKLRMLLRNYLGAIEDNGVLEILKEKWFEDSSWVDNLP